MKPLRIEAPLLKSCSQYPDPGLFREMGGSTSLQSRELLVRLWLTEGIPFAFRDCPALYDATRAWLGSRLQVCPKEITLLGSGRLGYSLASPPKYGQPFGLESDLDLSVVSESLFGNVTKTFDQWRSDYTTGVVRPRRAAEGVFWDENIRFGLRNIPNGFFDANKLPTFDRYPVAQTLNQAMWVLTRKLAVTPGAPKARKASIRVYDSWRDLVTRVSFNLWVALRRNTGN